MTERADHGLTAGVAVGTGVLVLCCALSAVVGVGALTLGLVLGLGGAVALAVAVAMLWLVRLGGRGCTPAPPAAEASPGPEDRKFKTPSE